MFDAPGAACSTEVGSKFEGKEGIRNRIGPQNPFLVSIWIKLSLGVVDNFAVGFDPKDKTGLSRSGGGVIVQRLYRLVYILLFIFCTCFKRYSDKADVGYRLSLPG